MDTAIAAAFCAATEMPAETFRGITRYSDRLLKGLAGVHGLTETWYPWVAAGALLRAAAGPDAGDTRLRRLLREHRGLLPKSPVAGRSILRRALAMAANAETAGRPRRPVPTTRAAAAAHLALRMAAMLRLIPAPSADGPAGGPTLLAVREVGGRLNLTIAAADAAAAAAIAKGAGLWNRLFDPRIVATVGTEADALPEPPTLAPSDSPEVAGAKILNEQLRRFLSRQYGAPLRDDPEFVHELRVCGRRIRAAFRVFGDALDPTMNEARAALGAIASELGAVRDADVLGAFLRRYERRCPERHRPFIAAARLRFRHQARTRMRALLPDLHAPGYRRSVRTLRRKLAAILSAGEGDDAGNDASRAPCVADMAPRRLKEGLKAVLDHPSSLIGRAPETLHELRIACKRLRYMAEVLAPVYPGGLASIVGPLADLQGALGDVHDADVYAGLLAGYRGRRHHESSRQADDEALDAIRAHLDARRNRSLKKAEVIWRRFAAPRTKKKIMAEIRRLYPADQPAILQVTG